jgi:Ca-activated chloride channel family protein
MANFNQLRSKSITLLITLNILANLFSVTQANPQAESVRPIQQGSLILEDDQGNEFRALTLTTDIKMSIVGLTARVKVTQTFQNDSNLWTEAKYLFPLPETAAVDHLLIKIGERIIVGEIKEKLQAKKIYAKAKIAGKKAALVEQLRPNIFSSSVANIAPYEILKITIEYQQDVKYDRNLGLSISFPMTMTPRYQPAKVVTESFIALEAESDSGEIKHASFFVNPQGYQVDEIVNTETAEVSTEISKSTDPLLNLVTISVDLDAGVPLQNVSSSSHKLNLMQNSEAVYTINFSEAEVIADHDFVLRWKPLVSSKPRAAIFTEVKEGENYLSLMIMPPSLESLIDINNHKMINREIVFVIDTSGSMAGESITQAKQALLFGLSTLSLEDSFNIIQFNSRTSKLFTSSRKADQFNMSRAKLYVNSLVANGGTEMMESIEASLDGNENHVALRQVIFLTDGAISNEADLFQTIKQRLGDNRLYTVGIGSAPNRFFMNKAASYGRGTFTYIANVDEARVKMEKLFERISRPQLTHITLDWPDTVNAEMWPARIPDLYDGEPLWFKAKVSEFKGVLQVTGRLSETLWQSNIALENNQQQSGVGVLWAREKIDAVLTSAQYGIVSANQKQLIIDTALKHHLVSRFTSLVAVDKTPERDAENLRTEWVKSLMPKGSSQPIHTFARTALDLDIISQWSLLLLIISLFGFVVALRIK